MLEIVLLILKIAGIILVSVLGILIVGLCCVLFVPVRYLGDFSVADAEGGAKKEISAMFRVTWLLRLIRVYVSYEESFRVRVKLLFFTLMDTAKEKKGRKKKKTEKKNKNEKPEEVKSDEAAVVKAENSKEPIASDEDNKSGKEPDASDKNNKSCKAENASEQESKGIKKRISNILQTIRNFCDKLKRIKEKTEEIKALWISDHMAGSRDLLWKQLMYLLKHTKPRKLEGYLRFGFEDPSTTGYVMAVYGILYSIWSPKLSIEPDFEKQILDCHIKIKGKIRACHFLKAGVRILISKDVRHVIKDIKKL